MDFQQPVSLRLARDIACHIIPSGLARFSSVAQKTLDSEYSTFLVVLFKRLNIIKIFSLSLSEVVGVSNKAVITFNFLVTLNFVYSYTLRSKSLTWNIYTFSSGCNVLTFYVLYVYIHANSEWLTIISNDS